MFFGSKKKALKDVLGELDKKEQQDKNNDDITGLENQIPIITDNAQDIEIPIPEGFSLDTGFTERTSTNIVDPPTFSKGTKNISVDELIKSEPKGSSANLNKMELMEQKLLMLQEENSKQQALIVSQKLKLEEYTERLGRIENENKKLKAELSSSDNNAKINVEAQLNRASIVDEKYDKLAAQHEEMKARVRRDIRNIRAREKELANKLEIIKNDSETLLTAKDKKILQLKQHIDNLEFEIETLKEKAQSLQELAKENEEKAERVVKALRLSSSLLEAAGNKKE